MTILVTGGAGYIGSHTVQQLRAAGSAVVVYDNLSTGCREAVASEVPVVVGDVRDTACLQSTLERHAVSTVVHFAASIVVPESVACPAEYYDNNTFGVASLIQACRAARVSSIVFSSTAAVYGASGLSLLTEAAATAPTNPYGRSKLMSEWMLEDAERAYGLRVVRLRYFNVAGAALRGDNGQRSRNATHLIKLAALTAVGKRPHLQIFGTDYETADGTAVRDYIHVDDLADIHVSAVQYVTAGGRGDVFNCGYGRGYSVREVVGAMEAVIGRPLPVVAAPRRPGDVPMLVADPAKLQATLTWRPRIHDLGEICRTAYAWERRSA